MRLPLGRRVFVATALSKFHCLIRVLKPRGSHVIFLYFFFAERIDDRTAILLRRNCGSPPRQ